MGIQLNDQTEQLDEINEKLDIAVEDRAPLPEDRSKTERFVFLKRQHERYPYYVIRAQQTSCKTSIKKQEKEHGPIEILLDFETHPNTKTYYSRIKLSLNKRGVRFCRNEVRIDGDITEQEILEHFNKINDEKRNV
jgi:hypothetical protein